MAHIVCAGLAVLDRIFAVSSVPTEPIKVYATDLVEAGGGPAATAAVAIRKLGGRSSIIGRIGTDTAGDSIVDELSAFEVDTTGLMRIPGAKSAWSAVAVGRDGNRMILSFGGTGLDVEPHWIRRPLLDGAGAVLVDMGWPAGARRTLRLAREMGIPTILDADLSPHPDAGDLIGLADQVFFSEPGVRQYSGESDPSTGLAVLRRRFPNIVLGATIGSGGCLWYDGDNFKHVAGFAVAVIDTLGAGDTFHGAYALAIAEGAAVETAIRFANAAAALKCSRAGGRNGLPSRAEVQALLEA